MKKRYRALLTAVMLAVSLALGSAMPITGGFTASAVAVDYPMQLMNIAVKDNSKVLAENGSSDGSSLSVKALGGDLAPSWRFDRVGSDANGTFFKIVNAESGRALTPKGYKTTAGTEVVVSGNESAKSQHWYAVPVTKDRLGNSLCYKIVNYSDTSMALTQGASGMTLASYSGADSQLWLLNSDGLQGFAGYCKNDNTGSVKAADIGGLFGEIVEASSFDQLKKYAESSTPYTIVITKNISVTELTSSDSGRYICSAGRIYMKGNKTIIGSYSNNKLYNVQLCTKRRATDANNIIIKNLTIEHDAKSNANDSIQVYFSAGENLWVDHVSFIGHSKVNSQAQVDNDKFFACCYDADYCTVSDSFFGLHEYGLILGYPDDSESSYANYNNFPRMSIIGNCFRDTVTRAPGLMRYGYFHSLNNFVYNFNMAYTVHSDCKLFAENCYYDGASTKGNVVCDWNDVSHPGGFADSGSVGVNCKRLGIEGKAHYITWRPSGNYTYKSLSAENAKNYCNTYTGSQNNCGNMMYLRFSKKGVPSAGFNELPSTPTAATFNEGATFRFKNANSGLYMQVEGAKAENNANIQQWGKSDDNIHDIWKLIGAGDGYYYIASALGDGGTLMLDIAGRKTANGTNADLYTFNGGDNQKFMFTMNTDGSYKIRTKITNGNSAVEVANASKESGANVQQWEVNGVNCQDWILEPVYDPGCAMDTSVSYEFKNVNSGLVMEVAGGKMAADTNVQQWEANGFDCQKWTLRQFTGGGNYYYICSLADTDYVLRANTSGNGGNINIQPYSRNDSAMLFKFSKSPDGTYRIMTRASKDACLVETASADKKSGGNIAQWEPTNHDCQKWAPTTSVITTTTTTPPTTVTTTTTTTTTTTPPTSETPTEITTNAAPIELPGDLNNDGEVNTADIVLLQKYLVKKTDTIPEKADINNDRIINVYDLLLLKRMAVRK